jgi:hypothetical protein
MAMTRWDFLFRVGPLLFLNNSVVQKHFACKIDYFFSFAGMKSGFFWFIED